MSQKLESMVNDVGNVGVVIHEHAFNKFLRLGILIRDDKKAKCIRPFWTIMLRL